MRFVKTTVSTIIRTVAVVFGRDIVVTRHDADAHRLHPANRASARASASSYRRASSWQSAMAFLMRETKLAETLKRLAGVLGGQPGTPPAAALCPVRVASSGLRNRE